MSEQRNGQNISPSTGVEDMAFASFAFSTENKTFV